MRARASLLSCLVVLAAGTARAHVGSPHIYYRDKAGPYVVTVAITMPPAVPGDALVQVRLSSHDPSEKVDVLVREIPPAGDSYAPAFVRPTPSQSDPDFMAAPLSLIVYGLYQCEVKVSGPKGEGSLRIPVPARIPRPSRMSGWLEALLLSLGVFLAGSLWVIALRIGRDAHRPWSDGPSGSSSRRGLVFAAGSLLFFAAFLGFVLDFWHRWHEMREMRGVPPLAGKLEVLNGPLTAGKPADLRLEVRQVRPRNELLQDTIPDHGKWMHLALVRSDASCFIHLHPSQREKGVFTFSFTPPESGTYTYFGDVLRASGESDTVTGRIEVGPGMSSAGIASGDPDDSYAEQPPLRGASDRDAWDVGDGLRIRWLNRPKGEVPLLRLIEPRFRLERTDGTSIGAVDGYMGMAGHLMALRADHQVFAHIHPMGTTSAPMALAMLRGEVPDHVAMGHAMRFDPEVAFPYAFPQRGLYRIWVQIKYEGKVRTGVFDAEVL